MAMRKAIAYDTESPPSEDDSAPAAYAKQAPSKSVCTPYATRSVSYGGRTVNVATRLQQPDPQNPGQFIPPD